MHAVLLTTTKEGCSELASAADFLSALNSPHLKENRKEEEGCKSQVFTLCDLLPTLQHNECSLFEHTWPLLTFVLIHLFLKAR